ncbi:alpha-tocopherol transfer protein-like [Eupeodes corollae]|uniref:alpha-tocopherol transfer protein-like n=1 Tax=Eupeodes corollae TaxID=290404 RepID=UPI0024919EDC|nr:alpha-tocopherol transfer protein-like [Eupeodes corollae]XP_055904367.1 alpha-tocopherol transfer protein-like [Eupeodes corollae]
MRNIRPLTPALVKKASEELNENPNDVQFYLDSLKHWLTRQRHLKSRTHDQFLIAFLRGSKYSLEKCKKKIESFYTYRALMPELFKDRDINDPKVYEILKLGSMLHLPQPISEDGPRVIMLRFGNIDFHRFKVVEVFKIGIMMADLCLYDDDNAIVAGYVVVMDLANLTPFHLFNFDPIFAKKITIMTNKALPSRMKGFHFINMQPSIQKCFNMVKGVINEKLKHRFYFHGGDLENLYKHIPKHCFPVEYGGKCETIDDIIQKWEVKLKKHKDFFIEEDQYGCNEKFRDEGTSVVDSFFGINGSFRKLTID